MQKQILLVFGLLLLSFSSVKSGCYNNCNRQGECTSTSICSCFDGFEGNDCSRRSCPKGPALGIIPYETDASHESLECSGRGSCDYELGVCKCDAGFSGTSCSRMECLNQCSGHGQCMSLREAAVYNDGYKFNRTTVYNLWDADVMYGCKCDHGYEGADCSLKLCDMGVDPRRYDSTVYETVTFACVCPSDGCVGKFKLNYKGRPIRKFLTVDSVARDVATQLMNHPYVAGNHSFWGPPPISAETAGSADNKICVADQTTYTEIKFKRYGHDIPSIGIYANLVTTGAIHFDTLQTLNCDCTERNCNGTFRLLFDGQATQSILTTENRSVIPHYLKQLETVKDSTIKEIYYVNDSSGGQDLPLCQVLQSLSHTYRIRADSGNVPRLTLWSSVGPDVDGSMRDGYYDNTEGTWEAGAHDKTKYYSTDVYDSSPVLSLSTYDGRDDNLELCNGIGKCDFSTGQCHCPVGWGFHIDKGPCGRMMMNSSSSNGVARCPGVVRKSTDSSKVHHPSRQSERTRPARMYFSTNRAVEGSTVLSRIVVHDYQSDPPRVVGTSTSSSDVFYTGRVLFNLTSASSAGPVAYDAATERLFFVDQNPNNFFIGVANVADNITVDWDYFHTSYNSKPEVTYDTWLGLDASQGEVFQLVIDPTPSNRYLYWTMPGTEDYHDGRIYRASLDDGLDGSPPTVEMVNDVIDGTNMKVVDPRGIAPHPYEDRLYWTDVDLDTNPGTAIPCIRSCKWDSLGRCRNVEEIYFDATIGNHTMDASEITDMVIDFYHNNTALVIDAGSPPAILSIPLDANRVESPYIEVDTLIKTDTRTMVQTTIASGIPLMQDGTTLKRLVVDDQSNVVLWSDYDNATINYAYVEDRDEVTPDGPLIAALYGFQNAYEGGVFNDKPVGMAIDSGFGSPTFEDGDVLDCHGNGVCLGPEGSFRCECFDGYTGDCSMRACPRGKAWFHEPILNNVAHDVDVECSNMGVCDRNRGLCLCKAGFEGSACQRMTCRGQTTEFNTCGGNGRCRSLRELASHRKDEKVEYVSSTDVNYGNYSVYGERYWDMDTWDADMTHGCIGDDYGYYPDSQSPLHNITTATFFREAGQDEPDQGNLECPYGLDLREYELYLKNGSWVAPDPNEDSHNQTTSKQRVFCTASAGTFKLNFRNRTTAAIAFDDTAATAAAALGALTSIGKVTVSLIDGSSETEKVCSTDASDDHYFDVLFLTEKGPVPLLNVVDSTLTHGTAVTLLVQEYNAGRGTMKECSGKGECNRSTGECECWPNWGSSDGAGNRGIRADCGYSLIE